MSTNKLVFMANQIALAYAVEGEARAVPQIRSHIEKYWDPRMRAGIGSHLAAGAHDLHPLALKALAPEA